MAANTRYLHIGDVVSLFSEDIRGFLSGDGLAQETFGLHLLDENGDPPSDFRPCLFSVCVQFADLAMRELSAYLNVKGRDEDTLAVLMKKEEQERSMNLDRNKDKQGQRVAYGDTIQLQHLKSGKFVSVYARKQAQHDPAAVACGLSGGKTSSYKAFEILPRFKMRTAGEHVFYGDKITLSCKGVDGSLRATRKPEFSKSFKEVNCSIPMDTNWNILFFNSHSAPPTKQTIRFHDVVQLFHPETESLLSGWTSRSARDAEGETVSQHRVVLARRRHAEVAPSLWRIENTRITRGGSTDWSLPFRLRSIVTGCYLVADPSPPSGEESDGDGNYDAFVKLEERRESEGTIFRAEDAVASTSSALLYHAALRIMSPEAAGRSSLPLLLCAEDTHPGDTAQEEAASQTGVVFSRSSPDTAAFVLRPVNHEVVTDVETIVSQMSVIEGFLDGKVDRGQMDRMVVDSIFFRLQTAERGNPLKSHGVPNRLRQDLSRELAFIDRIMETILRIADPLRDVADTGEEEPLERQPAHHLACLLYKLLRSCFEGHRKNEEYVAGKDGWVSAIVRHTKKACGAETALTSLLTNNKGIMDQVITENLLNSFVHIVNVVPRATYLDFLASLCQCLGEANARNQDRILSTFLRSESINLVSVSLSKEGGGSLTATGPQIEELFGKPTVAVVALCNPLNDIGFDREFGIQRPEDALADYFLAQVLLYAQLCHGRNHASIEWVSARMPFEVVFKGMRDIGLAPSVRAAFTELMVACVVDRTPNQALALPRLTRRPGPMEALPASPKLQSGTGTEEEQLKEFAMDYILGTHGQVIISEVNDNRLTVAVVRLIKLLLAFGHYTTKNEIKALIEPLVELLDGRNDLRRKPDDVYETRDPSSSEDLLTTALNQKVAWDEAEVAVVHDPQRYSQDENNSIVMEGKREMCELLLTVFALQEDTNLGALLHQFHENNRHVVTRAMVDSIIGVPKGTTFLPNPLSLASNVANMALMRDDLPEREELINIDPSLIWVMFDLIFYDSDVLIDAAIGVMVRYFSRRESLLRNACEVQLLDSAETSQISQNIEESLGKLRDLFETYGLWGGGSSVLHGTREKCEQIVTVLKKLETMCLRFIDPTLSRRSRRNSSVSSGGRAAEANVKHQNLLRNAGAMSVIAKALSLPFSDDPGPEVTSVLVACYTFLGAFVRDNLANQREASAHITLFLAHIKTISVAAGAVSAVFKDNPRVVNDVSFSLIQSIVEMNYKLGPAARYIDLLDHLVVCNGAPVRRNQEVVLRLLLQRKEGHGQDTWRGSRDGKKRGRTLLLCQTGAGYDARVSWMRQVNKKPPVRTAATIAEISESTTKRNTPEPPASGSRLGVPFSADDDGIEMQPVEGSKEESKDGSDDALAIRPSTGKDGGAGVFGNESEGTGPRTASTVAAQQSDGVHLVEQKATDEEEGGEKPPLLQKMSSMDMIESTLYEEFLQDSSLFAYHIQLVDLLTKCSFGKSRFTETCLQQEYPVEHIVTAVLDPQSSTLLKTTLLEFLFHVFIDSEVAIANFHEVPAMWKLLESFKSVIAEIPWGEERAPQGMLVSVTTHPLDPKIDHVVKAVLPCVAGFYIHYYLPRQGEVVFSPEQEATIKELREALHNVSTSGLLSADQKARLLSHLSGFDTFLGAGMSGSVDVSMANDVLGGSMMMAPAQETELSVSEQLSRELAALISSREMTESVSDERWSLREIMSTKPTPKFVGDEFPEHISHVTILERLIEHTEKHVDDEHANNNVFVLQLLQSMIERQPEELMESAQNELVERGAVDLVLSVVAISESEETSLAAFRLGTALLQNGNKAVQEAMLANFVASPESTFFYRIRQSLRQSVAQLINKRRLATMNPEDLTPDEQAAVVSEQAEKDVGFLLRFLQLMCEGHNSRMQNYLRVQSSPNNSVNVLGEVVTLLSVIVKEVDGSNIGLLGQIADTLTEFVQGPCVENQELLATSDLILIANHMLATSYSELSNAELVPENKRIKPSKEHAVKRAFVVLLLALLEGRHDTGLHLQMASTLDAETLRAYFVTSHKRQNQRKRQLLDVRAQLKDARNKVQQATGLGGNTESSDDEDDDPCPIAYSLFQKLAVHSSSHQQNTNLDLPMSEENTEYARAFSSVSEYMDSVEVSFQGKVEKVHFPIPSLCRGLTPKMKDDIVWGVNRSGPEAKLKDFMDRVDFVRENLTHVQKMRKYMLYRFVNRRGAVTLMENVLFALSIIVNLILLFTLVAPERSEERREIKTPILRQSEWTKTLLLVVGCMQIVMCGIVTLMAMVTSGYLRMINGIREKKKMFEKKDRDAQTANMFSSFAGGVEDKGREAANLLIRWVFAPYYLLTDPVTLWYSFYLCCAVAGTLENYYVYSLQLLDVVNKSETLRNVVRAVTTPIKQLMYTIILGTVLVYIFATFGFYFFRPQFQYEDSFECESLLECFGTFLDNGLRAGGGIGDYLTRQEVGTSGWFWGGVYGLLFFFLVPIIILNIVFGVIIDTFSALREEYNEKLLNMQTECFICSLGRDQLDRAGGGQGFTHHIKRDHNMWSYLYYTVYIMELDSNEYTGLESSIRQKIEDDDVSWMPLGQSLSVESAEENVEEKQAEEVLLARIDDLTTELEDQKKMITLLYQHFLRSPDDNLLGTEPSTSVPLGSRPGS